MSVTNALSFLPAKPLLAWMLALAWTLTVNAPVQAATGPAIGTAAPAFSATDSNGKVHTLEQYRGSTVVLEWTNHECPYTVKHYRGGSMQALQKEATGQGVVWLSVISSAPGTQGYVEPQQANALTVDRRAEPTAVLLDPSGALGRLYGAKTTPHMFIISADGTLVYMGAIDDQPSAYGDPNSARNYVRMALAEMTAGKPVATSVTTPYGCSVKYAK